MGVDRFSSTFHLLHSTSESAKCLQTWFYESGEFGDIAELGEWCLVNTMRSFLVFLFSMAVSAQAATTAFLDFQQAGQFSSYFNGDSSPTWSQSSSAGVGGTGGVQWSLGGSDVWVAKTGFQPTVGST
ncbi:hypothetical protein EBX31_11560, partial [bacterium]|nr:hypothetical protein [bacterium]